MKETMRKAATMFAMMFCMMLTVSAQNEKCPLTGGWYNLSMGGNWGEASVTLFADKKVGQNPYMAKRPSNGYIAMSDVYFENEKNYNLVFSKTIAEDTYEFTVQYFVGKQLKTGKLQIKKTGENIVLSGLDPITKKQPIHGKTFLPVKQE